MPDEQQSDQELIEKARSGNDEALQELVNRHLQALYTFCVRYMGNTEDAQDAVQETFLKAWRNLNRFDSKRSLRTWLFAIAKNTATDIMRRRRSVTFSRFDADDDSNVLMDTLADPEPLPEELFERALQAGEVQEALKEVRPRDRMILNLRYEQELSFEEIAKILKMSANTVRSLHRRALITLRKEFEKKYRKREAEA